MPMLLDSETIKNKNYKPHPENVLKSFCKAFNELLRLNIHENTIEVQFLKGNVDPIVFSKFNWTIHNYQKLDNLWNQCLTYENWTLK